jgi:hypothetical protein
VAVRRRKTQQGEKSMSELQVRIVDLEPMRCAGASGYGPEPEGLAWDALLKWAEPIGLLNKPHRFFGYNNPNPSPGTPNYGYDQWITTNPYKWKDRSKSRSFPAGAMQ